MAITNELKQQGLAVLVMLGVAIFAVLAMIVLIQFGTSAVPATWSNQTALKAINATVQTTITAFITAFALVGTFATVTLLIIVVKAIIGVVKGMSSN